MTVIRREPKAAIDTRYDLIIIGAGVYGIALSLVASQMGLKNLLLDKKDFGWATSYNSLRTIHGGLRYLQKLDLPRFFESVAERRWFLREFPGLVQPLPCLMPLYGNGAYRPAVFRAALFINDTLSTTRNQGVASGQELGNGRVISKDEVIRLFPEVDRDGLKGGAVWYDGAMPSSQLVIMEMLKRACAGSTTALNYMEANKLFIENNKVRGVLATDMESSLRHRFKAARVINAAGPWCRELTARFHRDDPELFRYSIAWNALFNKKALSIHSVAVKPKRPGARMYFLHGWNGLIMGGTIHSPWDRACDRPMPGADNIDGYIDDLNLAIPGLHLKRSDLLHIYSGLLPAREQGSDQLAVREVIRNHGSQGGPQGFYSVSGVKFTTARKVAEKTLRSIFPKLTPLSSGSVRQRPASSLSSLESIFPYNWHPEAEDQSWREKLRKIIDGQAVLHLDDLIIRRTSIGDNPVRALKAAPAIATLFNWDQARRDEELHHLRFYYQYQK